MSCGWKLLKYWFCFTVPLVAVLVYFHLECIKEKEETLRNKFNDEYHPEITDCKTELPFSRKKIFTHNYGIEFMLVQWIPCSVTKLVHFITSKTGLTYKDIVVI